MKKFLFSTFFFLSFVFISFNMMTNSSLAEEERCTRDGEALKVSDTLAAKSFTILGTDTAADNCTEEPDFYKMIGHKIALCTADPYTANGAAAPDFTSCTVTLVESAAGAEIVIQPGVEANLLAGGGELLIPVGSYSHAILIASNHLYIKHSETYKQDGSAYTMAGYDDDGGGAYSTGTTCYSTDRNSSTLTSTTYSNTPTSGSSNGITSISTTKVTSQGTTENVVNPTTTSNTSLTLACANTIPTTGDNRFGYVGEIIDSLNDRVNGTTNCDDQGGALRCGNTFGNYENYAGTEEYEGIQGQAAFNLLKNDLTLADHRNEVRKIAYMLKFNTPLRISENTVSFKVNVSTSSSVSVDSHWATGQAGGKVQAKKFGANPFGVQFLTKTRRARGAWR